MKKNSHKNIFINFTANKKFNQKKTALLIKINKNKRKNCFFFIKKRENIENKQKNFCFINTIIY